jgi:hypothetical protein
LPPNPVAFKLAADDSVLSFLRKRPEAARYQRKGLIAKGRHHEA